FQRSPKTWRALACWGSVTTTVWRSSVNCRDMGAPWFGMDVTRAPHQTGAQAATEITGSKEGGQQLDTGAAALVHSTRSEKSYGAAAPRKYATLTGNGNFRWDRNLQAFGWFHLLKAVFPATER